MSRSLGNGTQNTGEMGKRHIKGKQKRTGRTEAVVQTEKNSPTNGMRGEKR